MLVLLRITRMALRMLVYIVRGIRLLMHMLHLLALTIHLAYLHMYLQICTYIRNPLVGMILITYVSMDLYIRTHMRALVRTLILMCVFMLVFV